jgi:hypothetical protein
MNKRPGHVTVTIEQGYCSFCDRTRNLRREEHLLGTLVRTVVTCETCHRKLASSIGVAPTEQAPAEAPQGVQVEPAAEPASAVQAPSAIEAKAPAKSAARAKTASKPKTTAKPKTATRTTTRRK